MIQQNFIRLFEDSFRKNWEMPGFTNYGEGKTLSYADIAKEVALQHLLLQSCGIEKNDKIALIGRNSSQWAITYIAVVTYGAIIVPVLQDFKANDIYHIVGHSEAKLLFVDEYIWDNLEEDKLGDVTAVFSLNSRQPLATIPPKKEEEEERNASTTPPLEMKKLTREEVKKAFHRRYADGFLKDDVRYTLKPNEEIVSINYTSGTTGFSKGVMTSGNALAGNITFALNSKLLAKGYNIIAFLPLAHAYGCAFDFLASTCAGCHIHYIGRTPSPKILLKAFAEIRPNIIFCVPLIIEKIYKKQIQPLLARRTMRWVLNIPFLDQTVLTQVRKKMIDAFGGNFSQIVVGGAPLNAEVEAFFRKIKFPFTVGYGMTECAPLISFTEATEFRSKSSGQILPTMEVKIDTPDPQTGVGEITVKGEHLMSGYYKNSEATDQIMDEKGWLYTGDLGTVDEDGFIYIKGRNKSMILGASGQNIYPEEIEAKLNNMPFVMESLVIESDGKLIGLIYPDYDAVNSEKLDDKGLKAQMEENRKHLNEVAANYEQVARIELYPEEFEKTPKKSIKRFLYTSMFQSKTNLNKV